jgi:hypothetical protein
MTLDFTLYQDGEYVMKKEFIKEVNQSAFEIVIGDEIVIEETQYTF